MMKKALYVLVVLFIGLSVWYFFIKDYNYRVRFDANHTAGTVYASLLNWQLQERPDIDSVVYKKRAFANEIIQHVYLNDSLLELHWSIKALNDSTSRVTLYTKDLNHSILQNAQAIYTKNDFVKRSIALGQNVLVGMKDHESDYKISIKDGVHPVAETQCACVRANSTLYNKANSMVSHIGLVTNYIKSNNIPITGDPFLQVIAWDKDLEQMTYDFCFPIQQLAVMPPVENISFKTLPAMDALRADFNGNYRISDRAWYALLNYAQSTNTSVYEYPIEIYRNDPHIGINEMEWVAEVYMPLK